MAVHGSASSWDPEEAQAVVSIASALKGQIETQISATAEKIQMDLSKSDKVFAGECQAQENCLPLVQQLTTLSENTGISEAFGAFMSVVQSTSEQIGATFSTNASNVQEAQTLLAAQVKKAETEMQK